MDRDTKIAKLDAYLRGMVFAINAVKAYRRDVLARTDSDATQQACVKAIEEAGKMMAEGNEALAGWGLSQPSLAIPATEHSTMVRGNQLELASRVFANGDEEVTDEEAYILSQAMFHDSVEAGGQAFSNEEEAGIAAKFQQVLEAVNRKDISCEDAIKALTDIAPCYCPSCVGNAFQDDDCCLD